LHRWVKFGTEKWTKGPLVRAKFHTHRCNDKGIGHPKLKILLKFDHTSEYKHLAGAYPLAISTKSAEFVPYFMKHYLLKFRWIFSRAFGVIGFQVEWVGFPYIFQRPLAAKLCIEPPKVLEVQERARSPLSPCQVWWGSDFSRQNVEFFLFVCPSRC